MIIEVNGIEYSGWTDGSATIRLDALSNTFSFAMTSKEANPLPFRGGEVCIVKVDGEKILTGHIEIVNVDGGADDHSIGITGRDNTGDLIDSKIGSLADIRPPTTLKNIIERVIKHIDSTIIVVENFKARPFIKSEDLAAPEPGQDVWDFIQTLARKRQVLLSSNPDGNILITRSEGKEIDATLQHLIGNDNNNVLSYSVSYDTTGRYNIYKMSTQLNPVALVDAGTSDNETIVNQSGQATDALIRKGRQLVLVAENAGSTPVNRAEWESNVRKARGKVYSATVHGFRNQTGNLWTVNELIQVNDELAGINSRMLVNSVEFSIGDGGRSTTLSLVEKNSFTLTLDPPVRTDKVDEVGIGLTDEEQQLAVLGLLRTGLTNDQKRLIALGVLEE